MMIESAAHERQVISLGYNAHFSKAVILRDIPTSDLIKYLEQLTGKTEEEKQKLLEQFATEIEQSFPFTG